MTSLAAPGVLAWSLAGVALLFACKGGPSAVVTGSPPAAVQRGVVRTSELVAGPERPELSLSNPYEGNPLALNEGKQSYGWFNCAGCHGASGGGGIGPPLADNDWIYGGGPAHIFQTIVQGRPNGMPSFGGQIPDDQVWKIVLYVRSLAGGAGASASTADENAEARENGSASGSVEGGSQNRRTTGAEAGER